MPSNEDAVKVRIQEKMIKDITKHKVMKPHSVCEFDPK